MESLNRINTTYHFLDLKESESVLCRSFGQEIFRRFPDAVRVRVHVVRQTLPTLSEARNGQKPRWETQFFKDYVRDSSLVQVQ